MRCKNHFDNMETGSLIPLGPKCFKRATVMMTYVEIEIDGVPSTFMETPLCDGCYEFAKNSAKAARKRREIRRKTPEGLHWKRKISKKALPSPEPK